MSTPLHPTRRTRRACTVLSSRPLIRLVSEIDDHGAIPPHTLAPTLSDLSTSQIRHVVDRANGLGIVVRSPAGLRLTEAGAELAEIYDQVARWARRHNHPAPLCDFAARIHHTLPLLASNQEDEELENLARLLEEWAGTHLAGERDDAVEAAA